MFGFRFLLLFLSLILMCFVFTTSIYAANDRCPRHQVKTTLQSKKHKTKYMRGSVKGINQYLKSHSVLAFVQNPISVLDYYSFSSIDVGGGRHCVMLDAVDVQYISAPSLVMPSDYKKGSCEYNLILTHEKRHLQEHYNYYNKSVPEYKAFLGRIARNVPLSVPVKTPEEFAQIQDEIVNYFSKKFVIKVGKSLSEMNRRQSKIDSQQEYLYTGRKIERCATSVKRKSKKNSKVFLR